MRIISKPELERLTGRQMRSAQIKALRQMRIDHRINPNGDIIVIDTDLPLRSLPDEPEVNLNLDAA